MLRQLIPLLLIFGLSLTACGGLGGEPQIIATVALSAKATNTAAPASPPSKPDLARGARIFAEHCTDCHGSAGDGQGELALAGSIPQPMDMTSLELTSRKTPQDWYAIITNGNIEKLMPPWREALTRQQRWDVALYAYSLGYDDVLLKRGERIWAERCGECSPVKHFMDLESSLAISDADYGRQINHEDFGASLTAAEIPAAVAYARMQALTSLNESDGASADKHLLIGNFTGSVQHGTAGGSLPMDTVVQLRYGNAELGFSFAETSLDEDFGFTFESIPLTTAFTYTVGAVYRGRLFSRRAGGHPAGSPYHQNITVYDLTDDPGAVSIARIDMFIEAVRLDTFGAGLFISQIIRYRNSSDRIYTSGRGFDDGREASLLIQFPAGARLMSGDENGRYVVIEDLEQLPDSVIDTRPVLPGDSHEVMVEYFVPYADGLALEQAFNNVIDGEVTVTLADSLRVVSDTFSRQADRNTGKGQRVFSGYLRMDTRPRLAFEIRGNPFATSSDDRSVITGDVLLLLLGGGGLAAAVMASVAVLGRRRQDPARQINRLIGQIAQLDERHDQGQINHDLYHQQRRVLKARLGRLMAAQKANEQRL